MLNWSYQFNICCFLDNNNYQFRLQSQECLVGVGAVDSTALKGEKALDELNSLISRHDDWLFGHLSYDLKTEIHGIDSSLPRRLIFPDLYFFVPEIVLSLDKNALRIGSLKDDHAAIYAAIHAMPLSAGNSDEVPVHIQQRITEEEYISTVKTLQKHILRGDCYEINFCQEFYAENVKPDPLFLYKSLSKVSPNPFSAFYKFFDQYLVCASPERYLRKIGNRLYSQPIKGTSTRDPMNEEQDLSNRKWLYQSAKDRSENVMVVDLVRNDLSRVCIEGSVKVDELFGIYTFPQVHQMISTISGEIREVVSIPDIIRATFPMGSMTGAPKRRVMELIEKYEKSRRGLFSGAVGYISPERDMDLNVVIRSILYNEAAEYLSFSVGSGITYYSEPSQEYQECLIKAKAMIQAICT